MIIMNKLYKCALGLLTAFILSFACLSSASYNNLGGGNLQLNANQVADGFGSTNQYAIGTDTFCMVNTSSSVCNFTVSQGNNSVTIDEGRMIGCLTGITITSSVGLTVQNNVSSSCTARTLFFSTSDFRPEYTSLQCQTEYNLIPVEEITANYCKLNFDLIDPMECPINQGTGAIIRSNLMINDIPYAQNQNINVFIPDFLAWNIAFNDFNTVIEVEGYNADEEYIENVINQEKLTPTNKDIENMITGFMTNYFPYLALAIVFLYLARKIFKLFK